MQHQHVQDIKRRLLELIRRSTDIVQNTPKTGEEGHINYVCRLTLQRSMAGRWKRYLAVYFFNRWHRIRCLNWFFGGGRHIADHVTQNFSPAEKAASDDYDKLIHQYIRTSKVEVTTAVTPPVSVTVEIEVLQTVGTIQVETGTLTLNRGTRHFVQRRQVEHLIRRNMVREIQSSGFQWEYESHILCIFPNKDHHPSTINVVHHNTSPSQQPQPVPRKNIIVIN